jgi:cytochrome c oxidase accessory protein FixG
MAPQSPSKHMHSKAQQNPKVRTDQAQASIAPLVYVPLFEASKKIYPRSVQGVFARWRWAMVFITQLVFYGLPWWQWGARQSVLFDLEARRFYIFNVVLYPQDFVYLTVLLIISALSLFLFTAIAGRLWCGYTCPQTVYSEIFMWIEHKIEGDRTARMRLDAAPNSAEKIGKKWLKHSIWLALALWTGFTFVGYFTPIHLLAKSVTQASTGPWETFWILFYSLATYGNAGFLREQVCKYMCPYARFQGAMFDKGTLMVTYDEKRGESRGSRPRSADPKQLGLGDCIDCNLCVQVCPTGIDIRKGLQYECIGCAACIDVCDSVMDKMQYPRGLVKYSTYNAMNGLEESKSALAHLLRPRVLVYGALWLVLVIAFMVSIALRTPYKVNVVRDRTAMARIVGNGQLENLYRLQLMNATERKQHFEIKAHGLTGLTLNGQTDITVEPAQASWVIIRVDIPYGSQQPGSHPFHFDVTSSSGGPAISEKAVFFVPR